MRELQHSSLLLNIPLKWRSPWTASQAPGYILKTLPKQKRDKNNPTYAAAVMLLQFMGEECVCWVSHFSK